MPTQFAINEPDSTNSPNATYLQLPGNRSDVGFFLSPNDILFGFGAIAPLGDHDYFDIPLPASRNPVLGSPTDGQLTFFGYGYDPRHRQRRHPVRRRAHPVPTLQFLKRPGDRHEPGRGRDVPAVQRREQLLGL
jgi:hypothetical protein